MDELAFAHLDTKEKKENKWFQIQPIRNNFRPMQTAKFTSNTCCGHFFFHFVKHLITETESQGVVGWPGDLSSLKPYGLRKLLFTFKSCFETFFHKHCPHLHLPKPKVIYASKLGLHFGD